MKTNFSLNFLAVLAAGAPHMAPFMADECLLAMPDVEGLDYTMREYMRFVDYVKACVERLNSQGKHRCQRSRTWKLCGFYKVKTAKNILLKLIKVETYCK